MKTGSRKNKLKNDLDGLDLDQELTEEEENLQFNFEEKPVTLRESISRGIRSMIAIFICLVIPFLWYFDWDFSAAADKTSEVVTGFFDSDDDVGIRLAPQAPPVPEVGVGIELDMSMTEYAAALNDRGYLAELGSPAVSALYQNDVPIDYIGSFDQAGLLEKFTFPALIAFYKNTIPVDYITRLAEAGIDDVSFPAIISYYQQEVSIDYLQRLDQADYLDQFSFPAVIAFYKNDVTLEFLDELNEEGLLDALSFPDIVAMYKNQ